MDDEDINEMEITAMCRMLRLSEGRPYEKNEDGIPIKKIHVTNLHYKMTKHDVFSAFKRFGFIVNLTIHYNKEKTAPIYAFVTFAEVAQASQALMSKIVVKGKRLIVSPADTWHQPREYKKTHSTNKENGKQTDNNLPSCSQLDKQNQASVPEESDGELNMLDILNHDCIMKIFSHLHIRYLIRSERVSKKWKSLVEDKLQSMRTFKTSYWALDSNNIPLTTNTLRTLLLKFGQSLRRLHLDYQWSVLNERTPQIISKCCPNLTEIILSGITARNWRPLFEKCTKLKSLSILSCEELEDRDFAYLKSQLEELTIVQSDELVGKFLTMIDVSQLKKLILSQCSLDVLSNTFVDVFKKMTNLKTLCLDYSACFCESDMNVLLGHVPQLTELSVCYFTSLQTLNLEAIAQLKELRVLLLAKNLSLNNNALKVIVKGCPYLHTLDISNWRSSSSSEVTDEGLGYVWKLPNLEVLGMSALSVTDRAFDNAGINEWGSKLRSLVCRHNTEITNAALVRLVQLCPNITKIDAYGCLKVNEEFVKTASEAVMLHPYRTEKLLVHIAHVEMLTEKSQEVIRNIKCPLLSIETTEDFLDPLLHSYKNCCDYELRESFEDLHYSFEDLSDGMNDEYDDYGWDADDMFYDEDSDDSLQSVFEAFLPVFLVPG